MKTKLAAAINAMLEPMRDAAAAALDARPDYVKDVLVEGSRKARVEAAEDDGARARRDEAARTADHGTSEACMAQDAPEFESALEAYPSSSTASRGRSTC